MITMKRLLLSLIFVTCLLPAARSQNSFIHDSSDGYQWPDDPQVREKLAGWQDLKFGVLLHWGLYSVPGIVESWNLCNEDWIVRPEGSTYEGYKQWYWGLAKTFNPTGFDPAQWASVFADAGMKYMVFTTKHHDGFCLFDTQFTDFSVAQAGPFADDPRRDVARHVFDAFRAENFWIGAYFSKPDWHCPWFWNPYYATPDRHINYKPAMHPDWWRNYVSFTQNQLRELTGGRYGRLDILWLDGGWIRGDQVGLDDVLAEARAVSPGLIAVDRTIQGPNENYQTPEQSVPARQIAHPWESCVSLGNDWGWTPDPHYKSARRILGLLAEITAKGGCLLLGVGPTADGIIEEKAVVILQEIGDWLRHCGEAIYDTVITEPYQDGSIWFTAAKDGRTCYAVYALPDGETLPESLSWSGPVPDGKVTVLNNGKKVRARVSADGAVQLRLPKGLRDEPVALKFQSDSGRK